MTQEYEGYFSLCNRDCKETNFMDFCNYMYEKYLTPENIYLSMNLAKKGQFHLNLK